jgi:hypothetical protein
MWRWRKLEKISWTDHVRNEVLHRVKKERNVLHTVKRRKANWIGTILPRNCLLKEGLKEVRWKNRSDAKTRKKRYAATG